MMERTRREKCTDNITGPNQTSNERTILVTPQSIPTQVRLMEVQVPWIPNKINEPNNNFIPKNHYLNGCLEYHKEHCKDILQETPRHETDWEASKNGFVRTIVRAYSCHHNLVIRPDDVWLAIATQFSLYVNGNAEELRTKFVSHEGKKELVVKTGGTLRTVDYAQLASAMVSNLKENVKDEQLANWLLPAFSTTTFNDTIVGSVIFMASMQQYFEYKFSLACGIPRVTLLGTSEDWIEIRNRVDYLRNISQVCAEWANALSPVLDQFVMASMGEEDISFWQRICSNHAGGSGPSYLSGWVTVFCVFSKEGKWQGPKTYHDVRGTTITSEWFFIDTNDIPPGYCTVPVTIDDNGVEHKTLMFAGHMNMCKVDETTVTPQLSWAIVLK